MDWRALNGIKGAIHSRACDPFSSREPFPLIAGTHVMSVCECKRLVRRLMDLCLRNGLQATCFLIQMA
jgi:hypothetical protein